MSYPQGYLYQAPGSLALYSCPAYGASALAAPRSEELARSASGSAFSPYPGSAAFTAQAATGFGSPLQYSADAAAAAAGFPSYMGAPYDAHTTGMTGAISYHPYGSAAYPYQLNDPAYRKNATRDATATLKAWLNEHRKNPYPTKGEKIMLAIITKMTLTQVSTWFANARRRLKKENKMTWAPRNKSEDEDEDEGDAARGKEESADKAHEGTETSAEDEGISLHVDSLTDHSCSAESDGEKLPCRAGDPLCESGSECKKFDDLDDDDDDDEDEDGERDLAPPKPVTSSPLTGVEAPPLLSPPPEAAPRGGGGGKTPLGNRTSPGAPPAASKPKLWSLAEIATSDLKQPSLGPGCAPPGLPAAAAPASSGAPPGGSPYPASPLLGRHLYYTSPFYGSYTNYGNLNAALQGQGLLRYNSAAAAPAEALHAAPKAASDAGKAGAHPLPEPHYRPPGGGYEPKKDASEGCTAPCSGRPRSGCRPPCPSGAVSARKGPRVHTRAAANRKPCLGARDGRRRLGRPSHAREGAAAASRCPPAPLCLRESAARAALLAAGGPSAGGRSLGRRQRSLRSSLRAGPGRGPRPPRTPGQRVRGLTALERAARPGRDFLQATGLRHSFSERLPGEPLPVTPEPLPGEGGRSAELMREVIPEAGPGGPGGLALAGPQRFPRKARRNC
ncbi:hypothetical protein R6Z07F_014822 [Ovis aries]